MSTKRVRIIESSVFEVEINVPDNLDEYEVSDFINEYVAAEDIGAEVDGMATWEII